jgi:ABC-type nitrate/sulfonate/bicarbonate transport system permease component
MKDSGLFRAGIIVFSFVVVLAVWLVLSHIYPAYLFPSPQLVLDRMARLWTTNKIWLHIGATLGPMLIGFALAALLGIGLGYFAARKRIVHDLLWPYLVTIQTVPTVAILPLMIIWFGAGLTTQLAITMVTAFFPIFVSSLQAFADVPASLRAVLQTLSGSGWTSFTKLELPYAMPALFSGLKVGVSFALIGKVVAEFLAGNSGLGYLINFGRGVLDTPLVFAAMLLLIGLGALLQILLTQSQNILLRLR